LIVVVVASFARRHGQTNCCDFMHEKLLFPRLDLFLDQSIIMAGKMMTSVFVHAQHEGSKWKIIKITEWLSARGT
jgi:hypothetical protein